MNNLKMARNKNHSHFSTPAFLSIILSTINCPVFISNFLTYLFISEKGVRHPHLKQGGKYHFARTSLSPFKYFQFLPQRYVIINDSMIIEQFVVKSCYHNEAMETMDAQRKRLRKIR